MAEYPDLNGKTRDDAWNLLVEWVKSPSLRRHCLAVESAMRAYARKFGEPEEAWAVVGVIHDFDFERHPTLEEHPFVGAKVLDGLGYPQWVVDAVLSHSDDPSFPRNTALEKALFAVDELTGFISAVALVRPSKAVADVTATSVKKKMKDRRFAEAVRRDDLTRGADELGIPFEEHVAFVVQAMAANAEALGLAGVPRSTVGGGITLGPQAERVLVLAQYAKSFEMQLDAEKAYAATLETNHGSIDVEFFPEEAPNTVNNFVSLAREGYYDGTPFHRIIKGFMIQGGDPTGTGSGGPGYKFADESVSKDYEAGTLAMANAGPNTNGSQFFICHADLRSKLPRNYTIFGKVTSGLDVVDAIANVKVGKSNGGETSAPLEPVVLQTVNVTEA